MLKLNDPEAEVYLIGNATYSTGFSVINPDHHSTWSPTLQAEFRLQDSLGYHAINAAKAVPDAQIKGLLWLQGESDVGLVTSNVFATFVQGMAYRARNVIPGAKDAQFLLATTLRQHKENDDSLDIDTAIRTIIPDQTSPYGIHDTKLIDTLDMKDQDKDLAPYERDKPLRTEVLITCGT